jgi:predicted  nucleic acid-binding Zn-ribbon protein
MSKTLLLCLECGDSFYADLGDESEARCPNCGGVDLDLDEADGEHDQFNSDAEADADVLASAGWGTDEDYGYYGDEGCEY